MNRYVIGSNATGEILRSAMCESDQVLAQVMDGELLDLSDDAGPATHYFVGTDLVAYTPEQAQAKANRQEGVWSNASMSWVDDRDLAYRKVDLLAQIKAARDATLFGGLVWDGSTFDSDQISQTRLMGNFLDSKEPDYEPQAWRLADNSWRVLTREDSSGVWGALRAHIVTQFTRFAIREQQIALATTNAKLDAVRWED